LLAIDPEVPGSIPGAIRFSERGPLSLVKLNEELLERKVAAPVYETEINGREDPLR
jgi:hypothetical protein